MGYNTHFELNIECHSGSPDVPNCQHVVSETAKFCPTCGMPAGQHPILDDILKEPFSEYDDGTIQNLVDENVDDMRWYEHQQDMQKLSWKYPTFLFTLHGQGENEGDIWTEYYLGGKVQVAKAQIVIAEFSESLLR